MSIENHEFQDEDVTSAYVENGMVDIYLRDHSSVEYIQFDRDDIVALANSIELTGEDLK